MNCEEYVRDLYDYALFKGLCRDSLFSMDNMDQYIATIVDAFEGYPLLEYTFNHHYDPELHSRMIKLDMQIRFHILMGITGSEEFESVLLAEPPSVRKPGMFQYVRQAGVKNADIFFYPATLRQDSFENYAATKRQDYMDEKTWYIYIFGTKKEYQRKGYGKKLINLMCSYADERNCRLCLETNIEENVVMYEQFGFRMVDSSIYHKKVMHYVFLYEARHSREF